MNTTNNKNSNFTELLEQMHGRQNIKLHRDSITEQQKQNPTKSKSGMMSKIMMTSPNVSTGNVQW